MNCGNPTANLTALNQDTVSGLTTQINGDSGTIKCKVGYKWTDGSLTKTLSCSASGTWNFPAGCVCMVNSFLSNKKLGALRIYIY